jgi:hypothetical protein
MSGISVRRCPVCNEVALIADRGRIKPVGRTAFLEAKPGETRFVCPCGGVVVWEWRAATVGGE